MNYPAPQYPGYPQQQQFQQPVPQQFAPQPQAPGYPPQQGYPAPQPQQQAQPLAAGSIDDFYNQPSSGGGPSLKFPVVGTRYVGIVSRAISAGDVQQQTNTQGVPLFFKDGRPKFVMKVPLQMQPSPEYPDGQAQWYVKGSVRDELSRAMAEAGAPAGPPEQGAILDITFTAERSAGAGMNNAKVFQVRYTRPEGAATGAPSPAPVAQPEAQVQQQAPQAPAPQPVAQQQQPQGQVYAAVDQAVQAAPQQPQVQQQAPAPQPPAPAPQPPSDLSAEQQQLLARLTGGQG